MRRRNLIALIAFTSVLVLGAGVAVLAKAPESMASTPSAEVKTGLGIEKYEIKDPSSTFQVAPDTRIYAWAKVSGLENAKVTFAFVKGEKTISQQELPVPKSPHRTNAFRTFRKGDDGEWMVKVLGPDGAVLGSSTFKVEIKS